LAVDTNEATTGAEQPRTVHLPGLNGIRAIAAIGVVVSHTTLLLGAFDLDPYLFGSTPEGSPRGTDLAGFGVSMFFALSGFLITYLLLLEKEKQPIDVKNFYIRRVLRIHPLYYAYLAISLAVILILGLQFSWVSFFYYIFLAANVPFIFGFELPLVGHYWSLGVEEQFYLFYPWIVKKVRNLPWVLLALVAGLILLKLVLRYVHTGYGLTPYNFIHVTRFQCMLIGALGAWYFYIRQPLFIRLTTNLFVQLGSWTAIVLVAINRFHIASVLDSEFISVVTVFIILGQVTKTNRLINLDFGVFDFLGKISYGLYVIHPLVLFFLARVLKFELPVPLKYVVVYGLALGVTILIAYLSYHYFERYFLNRKSRFSAIQSSASRTS
jgi:peptidoglycan/LPS O-acetylase OafA/YrhL